MMGYYVVSDGDGEAVPGAHAEPGVCDAAGAGDDVQGQAAGGCGGGDWVD